jgi:hypothetical protein
LEELVAGRDNRLWDPLSELLGTTEWRIKAIAEMPIRTSEFFCPQATILLTNTVEERRFKEASAVLIAWMAGLLDGSLPGMSHHGPV